MNVFEELTSRGIKCELCGSETRSLHGNGWDNDRIICDDSDCGGEYVFPTTTTPEAECLK